MADPSAAINLDNVQVSGSGKDTTTTAFNISNFRSKIDAMGGILKNNLFRVEITVPAFLAGTGIDAQTLTFFCEACNLPGVRIASHEVRRYGVGPGEHMPVGHDFDSLNLNIIADAQGNILRFFRDWTRAVTEYVNEGTADSPASETPNRAMTNALPYYVNYKDQYATQVTVVVFSPDGQSEAFSQTHLWAFPIDIGDIHLNWGAMDELMKIPVRFSFMDVAYADPNPGTYSPQATGLTLLQTFSKGVSAAQSILSVIKKPNNIGDLTNSITTTSRAIGGFFGL